MPTPSGADSRCPAVRVVKSVFSIVRSGRFGGAGCPVAVHSFATGATGGMEYYGGSQPGSINSSRPRPYPGRHTPLGPRGWLRRVSFSRRAGQATEVSATQPVADRREQLSTGDDLGDVRAAVFPDPGPGGADPATVHALHGPDRGPAHPPVRGLHLLHETIYRSLFVQSRGDLRHELTRYLRTRRAMRRPKGARLSARSPQPPLWTLHCTSTTSNVPTWWSKPPRMGSAR